MTRRKSWCFVWLTLFAAGMALQGAVLAQNPADAGWGHYGGDAGGARYSTAGQITRENVARLKVAWTYRTGALDVKTELNREGGVRGHADPGRGAAVFEHAVRSRDRAGAEERREDLGVRSETGSDARVFGGDFARGFGVARRAGEGRGGVRVADFCGDAGCAIDCARRRNGQTLRGFWRRGRSGSDSGREIARRGRLPGDVGDVDRGRSGDCGVVDRRQPRGATGARDRTGVRRADGKAAMGVGSNSVGETRPSRGRARGMRGRRFQWMRSGIWRLCRRGARVPTISVGFARATTSGQIRWWR